MKLVDEAEIPHYSNPGEDAGLDLKAITKAYDEYENVVYGTGLAIEIPKGYVGLLFPRSSISKMDISLANSVGVIDSGYRGEIMLKFKPNLSYQEVDLTTNKEGVITDVSLEHPKYYYNENYEVGDKVGQLIIMPYPEINLIESKELSESQRDVGSFGSTGK